MRHSDIRRERKITTQAGTVDEVRFTCLSMLVGGGRQTEELESILLLLAHICVFSVVFVLYLCGCRVVTPKGIVCQHTIKAGPVTTESISQS